MAALLCTVCVYSFLFADGYQFPGTGARQLARGGAVTSEVSDWTSIYWNPAGLSQIPGRAQAGLHYLYSENQVEDGNSVGNSFAALDATLPAVYAEDESSLDAAFGSAGAAFKLGSRGVLGVGVYIPMLNGVELDDALQGPASTAALNYETSLYLMYPTLAYSSRVNDSLAWGVGASIVSAHLEIDQTETYTNILGVDMLMDSSLDGDGSAVEGIAGIQWKMDDVVSVGLVYRTGADVKIKGDASQNVPVPPLFTQTATTSDFEYNFISPPAVTTGVSFHSPKGVTVSFDMQRTFWSGFENSIDFDNPAVADIPNTADWRDASRFRTGLQWEAPHDLVVCAGLFTYDWAVDAPDFLSVIDTNQMMWTAGVGRKFRNTTADLSFIQGGGTRDDAGVDYAIGGWQVNLGLTHDF